MLCSIYKSAKKEGAYLYIAKKDDFSPVPDALMSTFGKPTLVMVVNLANRELAQVDVNRVKQSIQEQGFFLQLPPPTENLLDEYKERKTKQQSS